MYYPFSENKGADQLRGYREADLRLCFHLCKLLVFSRGGSFVIVFHIIPSTTSTDEIFKRLYGVNNFQVLLFPNRHFHPENEHMRHVMRKCGF